MDSGTSSILAPLVDSDVPIYTTLMDVLEQCSVDLGPPSSFPLPVHDEF